MAARPGPERLQCRPFPRRLFADLPLAGQEVASLVPRHRRKIRNRHGWVGCPWSRVGVRHLNHGHFLPTKENLAGGWLCDSLAPPCHPDLRGLAESEGCEEIQGSWGCRGNRTRATVASRILVWVSRRRPGWAHGPRLALLGLNQGPGPLAPTRAL